MNSSYFSRVDFISIYILWENILACAVKAYGPNNAYVEAKNGPLQQSKSAKRCFRKISSFIHNRSPYRLRIVLRLDLISRHIPLRTRAGIAATFTVAVAALIESIDKIHQSLGIKCQHRSPNRLRIALRLDCSALPDTGRSSRRTDSPNRVRKSRRYCA